MNLGRIVIWVIPALSGIGLLAMACYKAPAVGLIPVAAVFVLSTAEAVYLQKKIC